jgi:hypothetical protein
MGGNERPAALRAVAVRAGLNVIARPAGVALSGIRI